MCNSGRNFKQFRSTRPIDSNTYFNGIQASTRDVTLIEIFAELNATRLLSWCGHYNHIHLTTPTYSFN